MSEGDWFNHPDAGLSKKQFEKLKEQLFALKDELEAKVERLTRAASETVHDEVGDRADEADLQQSRFNAAAIENMDADTLIAVDHAIERMRQGSYGIDLKTGEAIGYKRLQAVPWATEAIH